VDESPPQKLLEQLYIPCKMLSIDELVETMVKAKSRRQAGGQRKKRQAAQTPKIKITKAEIKEKVAKLDLLQKLVAEGIDVEEALIRVEIVNP